jgi:hypothetical protein
MPKKIDLTGRSFGRLTVLSENGRSTHGAILWACRCACGGFCVVVGDRLRTGHTRSCGCLAREIATERAATMNVTHGQSTSRAYHLWSGMMTRCLNPKRSTWGRYGGRGITVCERWRSFENFYADMGDPPARMSLDRIDNDKGYEPGNCRWANAHTQSQNRRHCLQVSYGGMTMTLAEWGRHLGISRWTLYDRYRRGLRVPELFEVCS